MKHAPGTAAARQGASMNSSKQRREAAQGACKVATGNAGCRCMRAQQRGVPVGAHSKSSRQVSAVTSAWCVWNTAPLLGRPACRREWIQKAVASGWPSPLSTLPSCACRRACMLTCLHACLVASTSRRYPFNMLHVLRQGWAQLSCLHVHAMHAGAALQSCMSWSAHEARTGALCG